MTSDTLPSLFQSRHQRLSRAMAAAGLDALVLNPGPSLTYLTGLHFHTSERPMIALFTPSAPPLIVLPELEAGKVDDLPFAVQSISFSDDPRTWGQTYRQAAQARELDGRRVGVEPRQLRVLELRLLEAAAAEANFVSAEESLAGLRMCKDAAEVQAMRRAVAIAQNAFEATLPQIKAGMTERQLAAELTLQLLRGGSEPAMPFSPIVASGPNSANPHAFPTHRRLSPGDLLVLDWGATFDGYVSDLTRTLALGEPDDEMRRVAGIVAEANAAARARVAPGVTAGEVDQAARQVIVEAGYGAFFTHRTGHGLGMEGHEEPYIRADSELRLAAGMTFTIEPGIYLGGRGGVRVEDNIVVTETHGESLSNLSRELFIVAI